MKTFKIELSEFELKLAVKALQTFSATASAKSQPEQAVQNGRLAENLKEILERAETPPPSDRDTPEAVS